MNDYCPGAVRVNQTNGGGLDTSLPPRAVWHITWDALKPDGSQPQYSAVANYLKNQGYCPHLMWNPFTGYIEQYYPASQSARALAAWNGDGAACVQIEVFFTPGCVVDGVKYATVADTPLKGFDTILDWLDSLGIPRAWPLGSPQWSGNSRDADTWNAQGGHYGHCNVPDNTHTDPGPMPDLNTTISAESATITPEDDMPSLDEIAAAVWSYKNPGIEQRDAYQVLRDIPGDTLTHQVPHKDPITAKDDGQTTSLATLAGYGDFQHTATRETLLAAVRGIVDAVKAAPGPDAAKAAEDAYNAFAAKLQGIKITVGGN